MNQCQRIDCKINLFCGKHVIGRNLYTCEIIFSFELNLKSKTQRLVILRHSLLTGEVRSCRDRCRVEVESRDSAGQGRPVLEAAIGRPNDGQRRVQISNFLLKQQESSFLRWANPGLFSLYFRLFVQIKQPAWESNSDLRSRRRGR